MTTPAPIDCRSPEGETVGMIDAAIHTLRAASRGDLTHPVVQEALRDLASDAEVRALLIAAAVPDPPKVVESMCHWVQNRGDARSESHEAFHFLNPCPYQAMAAVLRGQPDPRDG